ncbi:MAG: type II toxin-antitoxin system RelE/ParE family toxin [bacterium]|nr:type II toxin-antitoxin system RelE/ParE family toxin [bacterium]
MRIRWLDIALKDFEMAIEYINEFNPSAAGKMADTIYNEVQRLLEHPGLGRAGRVSATRELIAAGTTFIIPYRVKENEIQILRVFHSLRKWPDSFYEC